LHAASKKSNKYRARAKEKYPLMHPVEQLDIDGKTALVTAKSEGRCLLQLEAIRNAVSEEAVENISRPERDIYLQTRM
jgi:hypothetical protein